MNIKTNKTKINSRHRPLLIEMYFKGISSEVIAKKFGYNKYFLRSYFKTSATKNYTIDGVKFRRCSICKVGRTLEEFGNYNVSKGIKNPDCKICRSLCKKNRNQIIINTGKKEAELKKRRGSRHKHKWRYNTRRTILRIINK